MNRKFLLSCTMSGFIAVMGLMFVSGCGPKNLVEIEAKILEYDPSFKRTLDRRDAMRTEISKELEVLQDKVQGNNDRISSLREEKKNAQVEYSKRVENIKRKLSPEIRKLSREVMDMRRQQNRFSDELKDIVKDISEIEELIRKKEALDLTQEELRTWEQKLAFLNKKREELSTRVNGLKNDIEMTRLKIEVLKI